MVETNGSNGNQEKITMTKSLLEQYEKVLAILENKSWVTKEMVFDVLNIDSEEEMSKLLKLLKENPQITEDEFLKRTKWIAKDV